MSTTAFVLTTAYAKFAISKIIIMKLDVHGVIAADIKQYNANLKDQLKDQYHFHVIIIGPIIEEIKHRLILESLVMITLQLIGISYSTIIAAVATSVYFGLKHWGDDGLLSKLQLCNSTLGGLYYSYLKHQYGFSAAIFGHMTNNFLSTYFPYESK